MAQVPHQLLSKLPKVKLRDIDWKWAVLLVGAMFVTTADDVTGVGWLLDAFELPMDAVIAMILSRNSIRRAMEREATVVQGTVVRDGHTQSDSTVPDTVRKLDVG